MNAYDRFCERYARHTAGSLFNAYFERPAMWSLVGDPRGLDVLDAGCATGEAAALFLENGARVVALDHSAPMVAWVQRRFGNVVRTVQADLAEPLVDIASNSVDLVYSSLALHYVRDWSVPMREFARVLRPGGRLLFSTHGPEFARALVENYLEITLVRDTWSIDGESMPVEYWHRPFSEIVAPVLAAGLSLKRVVEPRLDTEQNLTRFDPSDVARLRTFPYLVIVEAAKDRSSQIGDANPESCSQ